MDFAAARKAMVDSQVRVNDVTDRALQAALLAVPRERFLKPDRAFAAYADLEPEMVPGRQLMLPRDVAKLLMAAEAQPGERALAIAGAYAAAVLKRMGLEVTAQESSEDALALSRPVLEEAGVTVVQAPLDQPHGSDWDLIASEGALPIRPQGWLDALRIGGRAVFVERRGPVGKALIVVRGEHGFSRRELFDSAPPVLAELEPKPTFAF